MDPITLGALGAGTLFNAIGAIGRADAARNQFNQEQDYAFKQKNDFNAGFTDLINKANQKSVYQKDLSGYNKLTEAADLNARMASGASRTSWEQSQRNQAALTSANALKAATTGARSGTDIMTAALAAQQGENTAQENIGQRAAQQLYEQQMQANAQKLSAIGQRAAADVSENRAVQESLSSKENMLLNLGQQKVTQGIALEGQLHAGVMQAQGILSRANGALWDTAGTAATQFGLGFLQENIANNQMNSLRTSLEAMGGNFASGQPTSGMTPAQMASMSLLANTPSSSNTATFNRPSLSMPSVSINNPVLQQFGLNAKRDNQGVAEWNKFNSNPLGLLNITF